jgi:hypothetical protein
MKKENKVFIIKGDKLKQPEPIHHTIIFPGGHINVTRTTDNNYWAHIKVNKEKNEDLDTVEDSKEGKILKIRYDTSEGVKTIEADTDHFAVLISTL